MGIVLNPRTLIVRILSRTNYYPSLIQLYCYQIFQAIKLDNACIRSGPPFVITAKHVDEAYSSFQNPIREKFELTLNLDPRYRVLALLIALHTLQGTSRMMSVGDIRELAFSWWKQGFAELRTEEDFRVLLDEMQGLGICARKRPNMRSAQSTCSRCLGARSKLSRNSCRVPTRRRRSRTRLTSIAPATASSTGNAIL